MEERPLLAAPHPCPGCLPESSHGTHPRKDALLQLRHLLQAAFRTHMAGPLLLGDRQGPLHGRPRPQFYLQDAGQGRPGLAPVLPCVLPLVTQYSRAGSGKLTQEMTSKPGSGSSSGGTGRSGEEAPSGCGCRAPRKKLVTREKLLKVVE